jgi:hypothetical protein
MRIRWRWSRCGLPNLVRVEVDDDLVVLGMLVDRGDEPPPAPSADDSASRYPTSVNKA